MLPQAWDRFLSCLNNFKSLRYVIHDFETFANIRKAELTSKMSYEKGGDNMPQVESQSNGRKIIRDHPDDHMSVGQYLKTRITTLRPPMDKIENPFTLLGLLNFKQWMFFLVAFLGWTWDAFDFFTVSLTVSDLATTFNKDTKAITWGITLVLMLRSVGAIIFGIASDRYGRKWPFIANLVLFIVLELGTGFCRTYEQFLGVRAIYGIAMGGLYGNAAATALEDCPQRARGIISGMLQQGYAFGYLLATAFARGLVFDKAPFWRPLYWFGAGVPVLIIAFRLCMCQLGFTRMCSSANFAQASERQMLTWSANATAKAARAWARRSLQKAKWRLSDTGCSSSTWSYSWQASISCLTARRISTRLCWRTNTSLTQMP